MTTRTELLELIRNGENSGVEFKRDAVEAWKLARELVAFTNLAGGMVLLGVEDDGSLSGVTRANLEEWVMTLARDNIRPEIIPYFEVIRDVEPGRDVAVVRVGPGHEVHHLWHNHHRTYLIRVGSQCREASLEELRRLFQRRGGFRVETAAVTGAGMDTLDRRRLKDYFQRVRGLEVPADTAEEEWRTLLVNAEFMEGDEATTAGLLLFGSQPNRHLPQAGVHAGAYAGTSKEYEARERVSIRGPLTGLMDTAGQLTEAGVVEQVLAFVRRNTAVQSSLVDGIRVDKRDYPEPAVREAVVNALIHRDYSYSATEVEIGIYEDRLEVTSPGSLPNGINPSRMRVGCRAARNQLLRDVMQWYGYLEAAGLGVMRHIIRGMRNHNGTEPGLEGDEHQFKVVLWRTPPGPVQPL